MFVRRVVGNAFAQTPNVVEGVAWLILSRPDGQYESVAFFRILSPKPRLPISNSVGLSKRLAARGAKALVPEASRCLTFQEPTSQDRSGGMIRVPDVDKLNYQREAFR